MKLHEKRTTEALRMIREGHWTIRRAANFAGLRYREMLDKMAEEGIDSGPDLKDPGKTIYGRRIKDSLTVLIGKKPWFRSPIPVEKLDEQSENR